MPAEPPRLARRVLSPVAEFLGREAASGAALLAAAVVALVWANVAVGSYGDVWEHRLTLGAGSLTRTLDARHWVNEGLMTVFFLVVGLEIKREAVLGELRDRRTAALPVIAALGGMVVPALLYVAVTAGAGDVARGWGIPMATDIAFALAVLALLSRRTPPALKLLLLTLAIVDDVGAIVVIALFYGHGVEWRWLLAAGGVVAVMLVMRAARLRAIACYVVPSLALWACVLASGVHATIAGVALGLLTPATARDGEHGRAPAEAIERALHPWSAFAVVPLFALANAGVALGGSEVRDAFTSRLTWGVVVGLVAGKVVGISGASWLALRSRVAVLPAGVGPRHVVGFGALGGIGFTVSLFVADLAFSGHHLADAKIGVLTASVLAALLAVAVLTARPLGRQRR